MKKTFNLVKTKKLIRELETMPFDYNKSIQKQIDIIQSMLCEAGNSGFSASCVTMGALRHTHFTNKEPFMLLGLEDTNIMYPQFDHPFHKVIKFIDGNKKWIVKELKNKLKHSKDAHPDVIKHWKMRLKEYGR
jgi:hypothetical protein